MYGVRLCEDMGIDPGVGVVRVSLVHYNTAEEVDRLIDAMDTVFRH
jgi:selenocysteine lyase/cysteine desulfurase